LRLVFDSQYRMVGEHVSLTCVLCVCVNCCSAMFQIIQLLSGNVRLRQLSVSSWF